MTKTLLCIGMGYSAQALAALLPNWNIIGTSRTPSYTTDSNVTIVEWPGTDMTPYLERATHVLVSAGPDKDGDPFLRDISLTPHQFDWVGYLSTTGVYGDHGGGWVDEDIPLSAETKRGKLRIAAEQQWQAESIPLHIFRLAGIYGPKRGPFSKVKSGQARRIIKENQVFNRIHVDDIAQVLKASMHSPHAGRIYNLADDTPAPPQDVIAYAAQLLGLPIPPEVTFEDAVLSPMGRSFYAESKRVRNTRIKKELGINLKYPTYKEGLKSLLAYEG